MKWLALVIGGCLLVTLWARTVPVAVESAEDGRSAPQAGVGATFAALRDAEAAYREFARADSLLPLLPARPGVVVELPPELAAGTRDSVHAAIERELAGAGEPRARLGVFLIDDVFGGRARIRAGVRAEREIYVGVDSAGAYCAMVGTAPVANGSMLSDGFGTVRPPGRRTHVSVLGACAFVARYGAPGDGIASWLRHGGYRFAELSGSAAAAGEREEDSWMWSQEDLWLRGCRAGRADLCTRIALRSVRAPGAPQGAATFSIERGYRSDLMGSRTMLHDLEQRFGADRFSHFWNGSGDVQTSFAAAFGIDIAEWMHVWAVSRYGTAAPGARLDLATALLSALMVGVCTAIAAAVASRRRLP